jgi:hypothetical protein
VSRLAPSDLVAQHAPSAVTADFVVHSQVVLLILIVVVAVAMAFVVNATSVLWSLVVELLEGLWSGLKAVALLVIILFCLIYLLLHGGTGP